MNMMKIQVVGQRWHLGEQEPFPAHEVGLRHKRQYFAAHEDTELTAKV